MNALSSPIIGAQLDVARQKEPVVMVKTFIDLLATHGYNALYFYVEMSIRVPVVDFQPENESYSPEEIREIVAYGREKGILVIPALELAGHADKLLAQPNYAHLREGDATDELCISHPETLRLIETFLEQTLPLFSSPVVHFGYDELFHLASCPRCRERLAHGETRAEIFLHHLEWLVGLVQRRFPCRMLIWDDMFEFFPELLPRLPKCLELMDWEYDATVDNKNGKFGNRVLRNSLAQYQACGLTTHLAPRELRWQNLATFFDYGSNYPTAGFNLTAWCHRDDFMLAYFPLVAAAPSARQGAQSPEECAELIAKVILANPEPAQIHALQSFYALPRIPDTPFSCTRSGGYLRHPNQLTDVFNSQLAMLEDNLTELAGAGRSELANDILEDMLLHVKKRQLIEATLTWMSKLLRNLATPAGGENLKALWSAYGELRLEQWARLRPGIPHHKLDELLAQAREAIEATLERAAKMQRRLELRLVLPDWHGSQRLEVSVRGKENDFQVVYEGLPKAADDGERPFYLLDIPLACEDANEIRLRSRGRNGLGVVYAKLTGGKTPEQKPCKVTQVSGEVANPQNLLADDTTWCTLGDRDGVGNFFRTELHSIFHEVHLHFGPMAAKPEPQIAVGGALPSIETVAEELGLTLAADTAKGWNRALLREPFPDFLTAKVAESRWEWIGGTVTPELHHDFEQIEFLARENLNLRLWGSYFLQHILVHGADAHTGTPDRLLGDRAGLFQLMVSLGAIPYLPNRLTATWIRGISDSYRAGHDGRLGIWARSGGWIHREIIGEVVRCGRLEYEILKTPLDFIEMKEMPGIQEGDTVVAMHIPGGFPLEREAVQESLQLMKEHFANLNPRYAVCCSWLLNPLFAEKMPTSNFAHFQSIGKILPMPRAYVGFPQFVFGKEFDTQIDWKNLQPKSRLEKIIQDEYLAGRQVLAFSMVVTL